MNWNWQWIDNSTTQHCGGILILSNCKSISRQSSQVQVGRKIRIQSVHIPGSGFGAPGTVRISYATSVEELQIAMQKLKEFLAEQEL